MILHCPFGTTSATRHETYLCDILFGMLYYAMSRRASEQVAGELNLESLNPFPRLLDTFIDLVCIGALANCRGSTGLAAGLATDNGGHGRSPFWTVCACVLEWLCVMEC